MLYENRSFHLLFLAAAALAMLPAAASGQQVEVEIYALGGVKLFDSDFKTRPANPLPVLFVHGHNPGNEDEDENYRKNWIDRIDRIDRPCDLPSFDQALHRNPQLGIEPYYLRFRDQHRPLEDDAREIARAVDLILHRHDPDYDPEDPRRSTHARVVLIAMSKGTISSRLYLKWLSEYSAAGCDGSRELPCVQPGGGRPDFYPVSEFIAIAPPNHGLRLPATSTVKNSQALQQLNNGYNRICSEELDEGRGFIDELNGHPICDTCSVGCLICPCKTAWTEPRKIFPTEAPLSRAPDAPGRTGILYLTLFAENGGDEFIGGDQLSGDCQGRRLALNLAPDAVNVPLASESVSGCSETTHALTVHWPETICRALYTAAHHRAPEADFHCPRDRDKVPEVPPPPAANAVLALDLSGSMGWRPCPDCRPKVEYLREAAELFVKLLGVVAHPQDRIGAVYFRSQAEPFLIDGEALGPVATRGQAIVDDLAGQQPAGSTAMGGALHSAIGTLRELPPEEGDTRHVILFTDGMQNRNPMVLAAEDGKLVITDLSSKRPLPTGLAPIDLDDIGGIKIHTVGVGTGDPFKELLKKIADRTGGSFRASPEVGDLRRFFIEEVIDVLRGFSPQLVAYLRGSTEPGGYVTETVTVDGGARRVIFVASFRRYGELDFRVVKDGEDVTELGRLVRGSFYRILSFDLPLEVDGWAIEPAGDWQLFLRSTGPGPELNYEIAAIVDGVELVHEARVGGPMVAGRPLELSVSLRAGGQPVTGATVSARVLRSSTALGTLLATTPMPSGPVPAFEAEATGDQKKLQALLLQDKVWADLKLVEPLGARVELIDHGDGTYRGSYDRTSIPGTYKVVFDIRGSDERVGGEYRRTETLSAQVEIGELRLPDLGLEVREVGRTADGTSLKLTLRPRDRDGNYLGPDYQDRIRVTLSSGSVGPVADLLDGSYEVTVSVPTGSDPNLGLALLGRSVYQGPLPSSRKLTFGGHVGLTLPAGTLDRFYDPDLLAELDLEVAVSPRFALHGVLGRYRFDPSFDVDGATFYLRFYRPWKSPAHRPGSTRLFAEIGPGVYDPDGLGSTAGLSAGLGVVRPFRRRLESELGASYFHLFNSGDDIRFFALKAGLRASF